MARDVIADAIGEIGEQRPITLRGSQVNNCAEDYEGYECNDYMEEWSLENWGKQYGEVLRKPLAERYKSSFAYMTVV